MSVIFISGNDKYQISNDKWKIYLSMHSPQDSLTTEDYLPCTPQASSPVFQRLPAEAVLRRFENITKQNLSTRRRRAPEWPISLRLRHVVPDRSRLPMRPTLSVSPAPNPRRADNASQARPT